MSEVKNYVYGSAARKMMTVDEYRELQTEWQEQEDARRRQQARANVRALRHNRLNAIKLLLGITVFGAYFCGYIFLQNGITTSMKNIGTIQKQISDLKAENAATDSRIATMTSLDRVKKIARKKLGMVYASKGQIVYYTMDDEDYMSRYKEVK